MSSFKILYTSAQVRQELRRLFSTSDGRRVAISAFVGYGAQAYLPRPEGIELLCWPKPGSTNPNAIAELKELGIDISFADSLHMKVYWTEDKGAIMRCFSWMFVDHVVKVRRSDDGPCQMIQVWPLKAYDQPPFKIDKQFTQAFRKATREMGGMDTIMDMPVKPPARLLKAIYTHLE